MEINDNGIKILWDKRLRLSPNSAKIEDLPKEEVEEMRKAAEGTEKTEEKLKEEKEV